MILRSLELSRFGRFSDKSFEFRRGMNLVVGPNEAGKSTMMASIAAVLFGVGDKQRYQPWGGQQACQASLQFESQQRNIKVARNILTDQVDLFQYDGMYQPIDHFSAVTAVNSHSETHQQYATLLRNLLGISDEALFRATQFVAQGEFPTTATEFERFLRTILSGFTQGDSEMVLRSLHDDFAAVTSDNPWSPVAVSPRELEVVREALQDCDQRQRHNDELLASLDTVRQEIASLKLELGEDKLQLEEGRHYVTWIQQLWAQEEGALPVSEAIVEENSDEEERGVAEPTEKQQLEAQLKGAGIPIPVPEGLPRLLAQADDVRHQMIALQSEMIPYRDRLQKMKHPDWKRPLLVTLCLAIMALLVNAFVPQQLLIACGLAVAGSLSLWGWYARQWRKVSRSCHGLQEKLAALELKREQEQQQLTALDDEFEAFGVASSAVELVRIQKAFDLHREALQRWVVLDGMEDEPAVVAATQDDSIPEQTACTETSPASHHLKPEELPEALAKLDALDESIRLREADLLGLVRQEAILLGRLADAEVDARRRHHLEQRLVELEQKKQVLSCAIEVLQDSLDEFNSSSLRCFENRIAKYLRKATQGRYSAIALEQNFSARLKSRNGQWVALEQLSRGTMDAVCLAIRLGLSHFLVPSLSLPFFLDDALINLDGDRLHESVTVLERLSADHQIILFSHDERLHKIAARRRWHVIPLSERRSRSVARSKEGAEDGGQLSFL
ncbi:MAG: hypothetical protein C0620_03415 [Desulfuromonas sp.]|nr:MAG: hypothetical protein C0620_03415 [Desulfuromonas sp.]